MEREIVYMEDLATNAKYPDNDDLYVDDWDTIKIISKKENNFDAEKGFVDIEMIFQRKSDSKFFKVNYTQFGYNGDDIREQKAHEVFKKTKTIEYYD